MCFCRCPQASSARSVVPSWAWHWEHAFALTLLILLGWRFATLVQELALRPLFAWDAWMNWIPRAVVWFNTGELNAFVHPQDWLREGPGADVYTPGNWQAHRYPPGVSLIQLWSMLGAGVARHPLLCLPWAALPLALTAAFYGHLRRAGVPACTRKTTRRHSCAVRHSPAPSRYREMPPWPSTSEM